MNAKNPIFFCAIGGSGMLPLAMIMKARGHDVRGSDRSRDQGRTPERFAFIEKQGICLFPQDGSGVTPDLSKLVVSTAVEPTVPDYQTAVRQNIPVVSRAALLADIFNEATTSVGVAGTSGKTTTTGMIAWILSQAGKNPTVMNGGVMKNFVTSEIPFASAVIGNPDLFVSEVDESDGSIALFVPEIAVVNNIALDHKSMDELRALFRDYIGKASTVVLNLDNDETAALASSCDKPLITYSLNDPSATLSAAQIEHKADGSQFRLTDGNANKTVNVKLNVPGQHNVSNALAALGAAKALGIDLESAAKSLRQFSGIGRRLDLIGTTKDGITVIDDFAHNPDKIAASLRTLHQMPGRSLILFQPHGYGPLRLMLRELAACFAEGLTSGDILYVPDALYLGGTTDMTVTSKDLVEEITKQGKTATHIFKREDCVGAIIKEARSGDKIVIMGARDDTLTTFAHTILLGLNEPKG